jgi:hypothetical protein
MTRDEVLKAQMDTEITITFRDLFVLSMGAVIGIDSVGGERLFASSLATSHNLTVTEILRSLDDLAGLFEEGTENILRQTSDVADDVVSDSLRDFLTKDG